MDTGMDTGMDTWGTTPRRLRDVWADPVRERDVFKRGVGVEDGTRRCVGVCVWVWVWVWVWALGDLGDLGRA